MIQVHVRHLKSQTHDYCNKGARFWFKQQGLDWNEFVINGLPEETLLATNDAMAFIVVEEARKEWAASQASKQ